MAGSGSSGEDKTFFFGTGRRQEDSRKEKMKAHVGGTCSHTTFFGRVHIVRVDSLDSYMELCLGEKMSQCWYYFRCSTCLS